MEGMDESLPVLCDYDELSEGCLSDTSDRDDQGTYEPGPSIYSEIFPPQKNAFYCRMFQETFLENCKFPNYLRINILRGIANGVITSTNINKDELISYYDGQRIYDRTNLSEFDHYVEITSITNTFWINGSKEDMGVAKYLREAKNNPNVSLGWGMCADKYYPVFYALKDIKAGDELVYSYEGQTEAYSWKTYTKHGSMVVSEKILDSFDGIPKTIQLNDETYDYGGTVPDTDLRERWIASFLHIDKRMENLPVFVNQCCKVVQETAFLEYFTDLQSCKKKFQDFVEQLLAKVEKVDKKIFFVFKKYFTAFSEKALEALHCVVGRNHDLLKNSFQTIIKISLEIGLQLLPRDTDGESSTVMDCLTDLSKKLVSFHHSLEAVCDIIREVDTLKIAIAEIRNAVKDILLGNIVDGNRTTKDVSFLHYITPMVQATTKLLSIRYSTDLSVIKRTTLKAKNLVIELLQISALKTSQWIQDCVVTVANAYINFLTSMISFRQRKNFDETDLIATFQCVLLTLPEFWRCSKTQTDEQPLRDCERLKRKRLIDNRDGNRNGIADAVTGRKRQRLCASIPDMKNLTESDFPFGDLSGFDVKGSKNSINSTNLQQTPVTDITTALPQFLRKENNPSDTLTGNSTPFSKALILSSNNEVKETREQIMITDADHFEQKLMHANIASESDFGCNPFNDTNESLIATSMASIITSQLEESEIDNRIEDSMASCEGTDLEYDCSLTEDSKIDISETFIRDGGRLKDEDESVNCSAVINASRRRRKSAIGFVVDESEKLRSMTADTMRISCDTSDTVITPNCGLHPTPSEEMDNPAPIIDATYAINEGNWEEFFKFRESYDCILKNYTTLIANWPGRGRSISIKNELGYLAKIHAYFIEHPTHTRELADGTFYIEELFETDLDLRYTGQCLVSLSCPKAYFRKRLLLVLQRCVTFLDNCQYLNEGAIQMYKNQLKLDHNRLMARRKKVMLHNPKRASQKGSLTEINTPTTTVHTTPIKFDLSDSHSLHNADVINEEAGELGENVGNICNSSEGVATRLKKVDFPSAAHSSAQHHTSTDLSEETEEKYPLKKGSKGKRSEKTCPLCQKNIIYMSNHLTKIHGIDKEETRMLLTSYRKRKCVQVKGKLCPFQECLGHPLYSRLDQHLYKFHKLEKDTPLYLKYIRGARCKSSTKRTYTEWSEVFSNDYSKFLMTLDGGMLSKCNAKQHAYKMRQILDGIKLDTLSTISSDKTLADLQKWIKEYGESHESSSVVTYLSTFLSFLKYVLIKYTTLDSKSLMRMQQRIYKWKKAYKKLSSGSYKEESEISEADINLFIQSNVYKETVRLLREIESTGRNMTISEHTNSRNVLLLAALLRNCSRSCVISNMTFKEFTDAVCIPKDGTTYFIISVSDHKTALEHGPAKLTLSKDLHDLFSIYHSAIRYKVNQEHNFNNKFFTTWSGRGINSDNALKGLLSMWKLAGLTSNISSTLLRKTTTNKIHASGKNEELVARQLAHRKSTAERSYTLATQSAQSVNASLLIEETLTCHQTNFEPATSLTSDTQTNLEPKNLVITSTQPHVHNNIAPSPRPSTSGIVMNSGRGRSFFKPAERSLIKKVFFNYIKEKSLPSLKKIRDMVQTDKRLRPLVHSSKGDATKIKGCLNGLVKVFRE